MKNLSMKNFSLRQICNNNKTKRKDYDFARAINCTHKLTCVCACACACDCMRLKISMSIYISLNGELNPSILNWTERNES